MQCPLCGRLETGRVGNQEYYCWRCCVEFHGTPGNWRIFAPDTEGMLTELAMPLEAGTGGVQAPAVSEAPAS